MGVDRQSRVTEIIIQVVLEALESEGYDAVQLRTVAKRARVSLSTIYKAYPTRNDLIVTALERWMDANVYCRLAEPPPVTSLYDGLMWVFRLIFEPWERNPRMLEAFHRARTGPGGDRLDQQGLAAAAPMSLAMLAEVDPVYAEDVGMILTNSVYALIQRFADGELAIDDILPMLDRTVYRLTTDNADLAAPEGHHYRPTPYSTASTKRSATSGPAFDE